MPKLDEARERFHKQLIDAGTLGIDGKGIASNADKQQQTSRFVAGHIANSLGAKPGEGRLAGQSAGRLFEEAVRSYLASIHR